VCECSSVVPRTGAEPCFLGRSGRTRDNGRRGPRCPHRNSHLITHPPGMTRLRFPPLPEARCPRSWLGHFSHRLGDLLKPDACSPVVHFHRPLLVFTHQRLALSRTITARSGMQLQPAALVPDYPVVADAARALQTDDLAQFTPARYAPVIIFRLFRRTRKTTVVLRQIFLLQVLIRRPVTGDSFPPQFLDQSVPVRAVIAFHPSLGLRRTGSDDPNAQLLTHASELRHRHFAPQLLARRGFSPIHIFQSV
jgi:hypothetical protein